MADDKKKKELMKWADDLNFAVAKELWQFPHKYGGSNFSDIRDDGGNYYVDLALGGGGMLGLVHAGYIHALEESDLRFRAVAGTSAGALSAALLFSMDPDRKWKGLLLGALLSALDGDKLLDSMSGRFLFRWRFKYKLPFILVPGFCVFCFKVWVRGLISGDRFQRELEETLERLANDEDGPIADIGRLNNPPALNVTHVAGEDDTEGLETMALKIIASDITMERKLEFPKDKGLFVESDTLSPAFWVRASSSVPIIFQPVRMKCVKKEKCGLEDQKDSPEFVDVVDGGLMSNFPISVFHKPARPGSPARETRYFRAPRLPTFGIQLSVKAPKPNKTGLPCNYVGALISSMLDIGDEEFIKNNPDYEQVVTIVDLDDFEKFNLYLSREQKIKLFVRGYVQGKKFLEGFDWYEYKKLRVKMSGEE